MKTFARVILALILVGGLATACFAAGIAAGYFLPVRSERTTVTEEKVVQPSAPTPTAPGLQLPEGHPPLPTDRPAEPVEPEEPFVAPEAPTRDLGELFAPFWQVWEIVHEQFVDQPVDDLALMRGAIRGMLDALGDQHTGYMDPDEYSQANMEMEGEYEGIGAWVDTQAEYLTIISPMPGSPAEAAGLQPGDQVIAVDGEDMTGTPGDLVIQRVLGPAGTTVRLTIRREGTPEPFDVDVERAAIVVPSVVTEMKEGGIGYIQLTTFGADTSAELETGLRELLDQNPKGLILDLRFNGGGYLDTAIEVASQFIPEGVVMIEEYGGGQREEYTAIQGGLATQVPLVVLVNEGSASASEIVAGAIQDTGRGQLVGVTTFGKGSVQNWIALPDDAGAVRVTIARWLTPKGRQIHEVGLTPDVTVEITPEDFQADRDPQLEKAIEILTQPTP